MPYREYDFKTKFVPIKFQICLRGSAISMHIEPLKVNSKRF